MTQRYPDWLPAAEQATCAAALHCTRAEVAATGLEVRDFYLKGCRDVWGAILSMDTPSLILLSESAPDVLADAQRWVGTHWPHLNPASLRAHAAVVKRESMKRQRIKVAVQEPPQRNAALSLEYTE